MAPPAAPRIDDLWSNRAHFEQVRELDFGQDRSAASSETASWFIAANGRWFAFSRVGIFPSIANCPHEHMRVVVRESQDKGKTWSKPIVAVEPGTSEKGDGCAVLDGSTYYDAISGTWHLLAQCLDNGDVGGWSMCHYVRRAASPLGRFAPDQRNPVVRGGQLWSKICGSNKSCPVGVADEGTPEILGRRAGMFTITMHGFDGRSGNGYRAVVQTPDFRTWYTKGRGLPDDATLSATDCRGWFSACVGFGEGTALFSNGHIYALAETMDRSLLCQKQQQWFFVLLRSSGPIWPRSGHGWQRFTSTPFLRSAWPDPQTPCSVAYARWLVDHGEIYLVYEDWEPNHSRLHRRLLKLVPGSAKAVEIRN